MLPIHIFEGSTHYVLVRAGVAQLGDAERLDPRAATVVMAEALRRPTTHLVRDLGVLLDRRGRDLGELQTEALARVGTPDTPGGLVLFRARARQVFVVSHSSQDEGEDEQQQNEIETHWIEVKLVDETSGEPIPNARYEIELANGQLRTGRLDDSGMVRLDDIPPGECKVNFPDYAEPDEGGEVEDEEPEPPPPPNTCEILSFELNCAHQKKRKAKLVLPTREKSEDEDVQAIEVIGGRKGEGDEIAVNTELLGAKCSAHAAMGFEVSRPRPSELLRFAESFGKFEAYYGDIDVGEWLWPWKLEPVEYSVVPKTCDANRRHTATVRVFPAYEVSLEVAVGLDAATRSKTKLDQAQKAGYVERRGRPAHSDWKFEIEGAITYGSRKIALGASLEGKLRDLRTVNLWVKRGIEQFCSMFKNFFGLDLELQLPNLSLEYVGKYVELEQSRKVSPEWSLNFKAEPLIGVALKVDVLSLTIKALRNVPALTAVMVFLEKARDMAARSGNKLEFIASLSGRVGFELSGSKDLGKHEVETRASGVGEVDVGFEGTAEASVGVLWFVSFEAGANVKGATGIQIKPGALSDDTGVALTCDLVLKPLEFEYGAYASGKFGWSSNKDQGGTKPGVGGSKTFWAEKKLLEGKKYVVTYDGKAP